MTTERKSALIVALEMDYLDAEVRELERGDYHAALHRFAARVAKAYAAQEVDLHMRECIASVCFDCANKYPVDARGNHSILHPAEKCPAWPIHQALSARAGK